MSKIKLLFLHKHKVSFAFAKRLDCQFEIYGYWNFDKGQMYNKNDLSDDDYFLIQCQNCTANLYPNYVDYKYLHITSLKMNGLINIFKNNGNIDGVYLPDNPCNNLLKSFPDKREFYKIQNNSIEDNIIIIGTEKEKAEFIKKKILKLKTSIEQLKKEKSNLNHENNILYSEIANEEQKREQLIMKQKIDLNNKVHFSGDIKNEKTYDIIISILSIMGLSKEGWKIKYPNGKEEYLEKAKKKAIIIGVVGNGNKGKSFILGKLSDYKIEQGFTIRTEGLSIRYGEEENHCVAILDSAGQEMPLLNTEIKEYIIQKMKNIN